VVPLRMALSIQPPTFLLSKVFVFIGELLLNSTSSLVISFHISIFDSIVVWKSSDYLPHVPTLT
jgi:hypothetical protein